MIVLVTCCCCGAVFDERLLGGSFLNRVCPCCGQRISEEGYDALARRLFKTARGYADAANSAFALLRQCEETTEALRVRLEVLEGVRALSEEEPPEPDEELLSGPAAHYDLLSIPYSLVHSLDERPRPPAPVVEVPFAKPERIGTVGEAIQYAYEQARISMNTDDLAFFAQTLCVRKPVSPWKIKKSQQVLAAARKACASERDGEDAKDLFEVDFGAYQADADFFEVDEEDLYSSGAQDLHRSGEEERAQPDEASELSEEGPLQQEAACEQAAAPGNKEEAGVQPAAEDAQQGDGQAQQGNSCGLFAKACAQQERESASQEPAHPQQGDALVQGAQACEKPADAIAQQEGVAGSQCVDGEGKDDSRSSGGNGARNDASWRGGRGSQAYKPRPTVPLRSSLSSMLGDSVRDALLLFAQELDEAAEDDEAPSAESREDAMGAAGSDACDDAPPACEARVSSEQGQDVAWESDAAQGPDAAASAIESAALTQVCEEAPSREEAERDARIAELERQLEALKESSRREIAEVKEQCNGAVREARQKAVDDCAALQSRCRDEVARAKERSKEQRALLRDRYEECLVELERRYDGELARIQEEASEEHRRRLVAEGRADDMTEAERFERRQAALLFELEMGARDARCAKRSLEMANKREQAVLSTIQCLALSRYYTSEWFRLTRIPDKGVDSFGEQFSFDPRYTTNEGLVVDPDFGDARNPRRSLGQYGEYLVFERLRVESLNVRSPLFGARILPNLVFSWRGGTPRGTQWAQVDCLILTRSFACVVEVKRWANTRVKTKAPFDEIALRDTRFDDLAGQEGAPDEPSRYEVRPFTQARHASEALASLAPCYGKDRILHATVFVDPEKFRSDSDRFAGTAFVGWMTKGRDCGNFVEALRMKEASFAPVIDEQELAKIADEVFEGTNDIGGVRSEARRQWSERDLKSFFHGWAYSPRFGWLQKKDKGALG